MRMNRRDKRAWNNEKDRKLSDDMRADARPRNFRFNVYMYIWGALVDVALSCLVISRELKRNIVGTATGSRNSAKRPFYR